MPKRTPPTYSRLSASGDQPARGRREEVGLRVVDPAVVDDDRPAVADRVLDHALPGEQAGERDHERRDADQRDERALERADPRRDEQRDQDRENPLEVVTRSLFLQHRCGHAGDPAQEGDREVDLADEQDEDDAEREHRRARHLGDDVVEVDRREEVLRGQAEDDHDDRQPEDHGRAAEIPALDVLPEPRVEALDRLGGSTAVGAATSGADDVTPSLRCRR